jgi:6-pyruvoyltetrahydropterin/6-carboxytetrahydropterin synthase
MTVRVGRRYVFPAAHSLHTSKLSDAQNRELYGKCNNPFGHGHNYEVVVVVSGTVDAVTGRAVDLARLDELAEEQFLRQFRYRDLNVELPFIPTTENLAFEIERRLRAAWPEDFPVLDKIRILETDRNICEVGHGL